MQHQTVNQILKILHDFRAIFSVIRYMLCVKINGDAIKANTIGKTENISYG